MLATEEKPKWAMPVSLLREFAKHRNLRVFKGGAFRLVFVDRTDPVGEIMLRPVWLRYESRNVWGRFRFIDPSSGERVWMCAPYYRCIEGFAQMLEYDQVFRVTHFEDVKLYDTEEREEILKKMERMGETEEWLLPKNAPVAEPEKGLKAKSFPKSKKQSLPSQPERPCSTS
jgi:hypothetical protein